MHSASRNINEKNFPVFKKLIEEVILKSTGEPYTNNSFIAKKLSKSTGNEEWFIPEAKAKEIADSVFASSNHIENNGRRLQTIINKTLNDVPINTWLRTLDSLVEFVWKEEDNHQLEKDKNDVLLYWKSYLEKNDHLLLHDVSNSITDIKEDVTEAETDTTPQVQPEEKISFEQAPQNKILEAENTHAEFESNATSVHHKKQPETKKIIRAGMYGGACAGFFGVIVIVALRYFTVPIVPTGYENISKDNFFQVFPIIFLFHILGGALLGWLCWRNAFHRANIFKSVLLFLVAFLLQIFIRQSTVRNAWRPAGEYTVIENGNPVIRSGGPLGEPDFEALATGLMGAVSFIVLVSALRRRAPKIPSKKETFGIILFAAIPGTGAWCLVYFIFKVFSHFGILREHDFFISKTVFYFVFPHPERVFLVALLSMMYVYCIIASVQYHASGKMLLSDNPGNKSDQSSVTQDIRLKPLSVLFQISNKKFKGLIVFSLSALFAFILISYFAFQNALKEDISIDFKTSFKNIYTLDELYNTGWKILDADTTYLHEGLKNANGKGLQLYTLPGDYWIMDTMRRFIKNTFALPIPPGDFKAEVSLSMTDIDNLNCGHQQAGIILLNDTGNLTNNVRYAVVPSLPGTGPSFTEIYSKAKPEKNQWNQNLNDIISQKGFPDSEDSIQDTNIKREKLNEIGLQIIKYHGYFIFRFKAGGDDRPFHPAFVEQFGFEPKFICLAAFQGQVNHREKLFLCDNIPVTFSDFHISPNDKDDKILLDNLLKKYQ